MPVQFRSENGKCYARWGDQGAKYFFTCGDEVSKKRAEDKAKEQGKAIEASKNER